MMANILSEVTALFEQHNYCFNLQPYKKLTSALVSSITPALFKYYIKLGIKLLRVQNTL